MAELPGDEASRERIRSDLDGTFLVEAAAGTGKTTELVRRILALVTRERARLSRIVAVTFTEKAAAEMKLRVRAELERARRAEATTDGERAAIEVALSELEEARISTIHGFCGDLLRERPLEAGVDPLFAIAGDDQARVYAEVFDAWFASVSADPGPGVRRVLRRRRKDMRSEGPRDHLFQAGLALIDLRDFDAPYTRVEVDREGRIDAVIDELDALSDLYTIADNKADWLAQNLANVRRFVDELQCREEIRDGGNRPHREIATSGDLRAKVRDYEGLEAELGQLVHKAKFHWKGRSGGTFAKGHSTTDVRRRRDRAHASLQALLADLDADLAAALREELRPLVAAYEARMNRLGKVDFLDLLLRARNLLRDRPDVRLELAERFSHILVDEFQDTDPLQAEVILLLASTDEGVVSPWEARLAPGKLFVVGDPKQSIYRFRRADIAVYERVKARLVAAGGEVLSLSRSHRALPAIQGLANAAFSRVMTGGAQASYVPLEPVREARRDRPSVIALPAPKPYTDKGFVAKYQIEASYAEAVAAFVSWLVHDSGWTIREGEADVPVEARHVAILFKNLTSFGDDLARPVADALEARAVRHVLLGGRGFHDREEVRAVRSALAAIEWPDDELSVYATLKGPFFAFTDEALFVAHGALRGLSPVRPRTETDLPEVAREVPEALDLLRALHRRRNRRPIADTLTELFAATRAHAAFANWPAGEQALANALRVVDLARRFEGQRPSSFRAFVEKLEDDAEGRVREGEAPLVEAETDGVRMMTVHASKGLEFPVVILASPGVNATHERPSRWVDQERGLAAVPLAHAVPEELRRHADEVLERDREENARLAYVAVTRARDLLVVPVVGCDYKGQEDGWLAMVRDALRPPDGERARPDVPGCPPFGTTTVLDAPERDFPSRAPERPGLYRSGTGDFRYVVWDPAQLALDRKNEEGVREAAILRADKGDVNVERGVAAHRSWADDRALTLADGAKPTLLATRVTDAAKASSRAKVRRDVVQGRDPSRPRGPRFGTLLHAALAEVPLDADPPLVAVWVERVARLVDAGRGEIDHAVAALVAALASPTLVEARASSDVRREVWITTRRDGGVVEGVVDLAFRTADGWVVVDHKSDLDVSDAAGPYDAQVTLYAEAIAAATGEPATPRLLFV